MTRVLVTGASGFIGRHLVRRLADAGYAVRAFARRPQGLEFFPEGVEVAVGDVRDARAMKAATQGCHGVFHLAAKVHDRHATAEKHRLIEVEGTRNVVDAAVACGVRRLVFFSTVAVMGEPPAGCVDESFQGVPVSAYGLAKLEAERLVLSECELAGIGATCLRPPLVYGPGNKGNFLRMMAAIDAGWFPPLPDTGNRKSLVHVANLVDAALLAATSPGAGPRSYIVADARAYSTRALYEAIARALGRRVLRWSVPLFALRALGMVGDAIGSVRGRRFVFDTEALAKLVESSWYSSAKIARELGYQPRVSLEEALPDLVAWYRTMRS